MHTDIKALRAKKRGLVEEKLITFVHQQHHTCEKILRGGYNAVFHLGQETYQILFQNF